MCIRDRYAVLSADKKSVILVKEFRDIESYNEWKEKAAALPAVDDLMTSEEGTFFDEKPDVESGEKDISIDYSGTPSGVSGDHK